MEVSKLSFTKKTQDKMNKNMSVREKGRILFARLQELEADGTLSKAKSRADVARLVGYPEERAKAGYSWISNLISRGHVSETVQEWTPSGKMVAEYHTTGSMPAYGYEEVNRRKRKKQAIAKVAEETIEREKVIANTPIKMEITKGGMTIKVEFAEVEQATNLITTIMKGDTLCQR